MQFYTYEAECKVVPLRLEAPHQYRIWALDGSEWETHALAPFNP